MKKIIVCHGDKGGVGKSVFAMIATEYCIANGLNTAVVDGDANVNDIANRYSEDSNVQSILIDLDKSGNDAQDAVTLLFNHIERMGHDIVILNMPANSTKILKDSGELIVDVANDLGYETIVVWMLGKDEASAKLSASCEICNIADKKIAVVNRIYGDNNANYYWFINPVYRNEWVQSGGLVTEIPALNNIAMTAIRNNPDKPLYVLAGKDNSSLTTIEKSGIKIWMKKSWANVMPLIFGDNT